MEQALPAALPLPALPALLLPLPALPLSSDKYRFLSSGPQSQLEPLVLTEALREHIHTEIMNVWGLKRLLLSHLPCSSPTSLMREDIPRVLDGDYYVGLKTDGVRMFLFLCCHNDTNYAVFIDRAFNMYSAKVDTRDPQHSRYFLGGGTMFDGELITARAGTGTEFVVFDVMRVCGRDTTHHLFSERLARIQTAFAQVTTQPGLTVTVKTWTRVRDIKADPDSFVHMYTSHQDNGTCDGLIFVNEYGSLYAGTQGDMFKWKKAAHHTVDFLWDAEHKALVLCSRSQQQYPYVLADTINVFMVPHWRENNIRHGEIIECSLKRDENAVTGWHATPVCIRDDKKRPNNINIALLTIRNVVENVELEDIFSA